jgi:hypothetical protein
MKYSILYKDALGVTGRSEFIPFDVDAEAAAYARAALPQNALIEVWKGDGLVVRLERGGAGQVA